MLQENLHGSTDPKSKYENPEIESEANEDAEEGFDILPSNGPGLADDDGEQTVDSDEDDEFDEGQGD